MEDEEKKRELTMDAKRCRLSISLCTALSCQAPRKRSEQAHLFWLASSRSMRLLCDFSHAHDEQGDETVRTTR